MSRAIPQQVRGLYHAGSVGIIMSGWLGAMNYGVIVANEVDGCLMSSEIAMRHRSAATRVSRRVKPQMDADVSRWNW